MERGWRGGSMSLWVIHVIPAITSVWFVPGADGQ